MIAAIFVGRTRCGGARHRRCSPSDRVPRRDEENGTSLREEAAARKHSALVAIVDMENEHSAGKLSDADLATLKTQYELEALKALHDLDALLGRR